MVSQNGGTHRAAQTVLVALIATVAAAPFALASTEVVAMWTRIYRNAETLERRLEVAQALVEQDDPLLAPLFEEALSRLVADERSHTSLIERQTYNRMLTLVITELGQLRAVEAAPAVMQVVEFSEDDGVRMAAVAALGRMGAQQFAGDLATLLRSLNFESAARRGAREQLQLKERLARATVVALGRLREVVGFEPAFFASIGWYSRDSGVAEQAQLAMDAMVSDPSPLFEDMHRRRRRLRRQAGCASGAGQLAVAGGRQGGGGGRCARARSHPRAQQPHRGGDAQSAPQPRR